jgi:hypothetical protein
MPTHAEELFNKYRNVAAIEKLIGKCEDAYLDCKEWPARDDDAQKTIAKAICGFSNADGGVLIIGMKAESRPKDEPDVITAKAPVHDTALVKSRVLDWAGNLVEPGIVGINVREVKEAKGKKSGYVVAFAPGNEGRPRRSRKDWKFYQRIGSGTFPMEYRQIEDMFGKRPHPKLELVLEKVRFGLHVYDQQPRRIFRLGLANVGRGLARFSGIRFKGSCGLMPDQRFGLDGNGNIGLPLRASDGGWVIFRGGIDDVIYPNDTLAITLLLQEGENLGKVATGTVPGGGLIQENPNETKWRFKPISFSCEISCEGLPTISVNRSFEEEEHFTLYS